MLAVFAIALNFDLALTNLCMRSLNTSGAGLTAPPRGISPRSGEETLMQQFDQIGVGRNSEFDAARLFAGARRGASSAHQSAVPV